ncbi:serine hydrolase [Paenibacillus frigoriresistens]|uniref:serine hydrolase domain-containing protein n=1 Tax=Paenibacillus alginolyticus TaxID=59839 RepID=UPI0015659B15|nr:serine hydrolase [Paenibacillus frigoriresistens]NRF95116.1 serine hydrolase [Paenibacillus frigoriresistens]
MVEANSISKSFTLTAIGMAVNEGLLSLDDTVISFFPEEVTPSIASNMASLKVRHLLTMSTGHAIDTTPVIASNENGAKAFLEIPIVHEPGTAFLYNTGATYMLSAILNKVTGKNLLEILQPRLFEPLGMSGITSLSCPRGIHVGGFGMSIKTEDIAKLGLLYLQKGMRNGERILREEWVKEATAFHVANGIDPDSDWAQGYGFQFWRCRHDAYRADGAFEQFCIVLPEKEAVIAITGGAMEMQSILDCVWEHLLPGMSDTPLYEGPEDEEMLERKLNSLSYPVQVIKTASSDDHKWHDKSYEIGPNDAGITQITFHLSNNEFSLTFQDNTETQTLRIGNGHWLDSQNYIAREHMKVKASGTWRKKNVLEITLRFVETAYCDIWRVSFR